MSDIKKTKKNIHSNIMFPKVTSHTNKKNNNKPPTEFIDALLNKNNTKDSMKKNIIAFNKSSGNNIQTNGDGKIIENFHKAIKLTNSDEIILKMLDLKEKDIINFYKNMEKMIGKDLSLKIRNDMSKQLITGATVVNKNGTALSLCPFCSESKSNCVILLCGHLLCNKCAKNINRSKFPCPKCKKPIKYIQFISV
tara:strand:+ start:605 stop:1189 length:585 start_codon:yes stop_codon:yes gene_type:complete